MDGVDYESLTSVIAVAIAIFTKLNHNLSHQGRGQSAGVWENLDTCWTITHTARRKKTTLISWSVHEWENANTRPSFCESQTWGYTKIKRKTKTMSFSRFAEKSPRSHFFPFGLSRSMDLLSLFFRAPLVHVVFPSSRLPGAMLQRWLRCSGGTNSATKSSPGKKRKNYRRRLRVPHDACLPPTTTACCSCICICHNLPSENNLKIRVTIRLWSEKFSAGLEARKLRKFWGFKKPSVRDGLKKRV